MNKNKGVNTRLSGGAPARLLLCVLFLVPQWSCVNEPQEDQVAIYTFPVESGGIIYGGWTPVKIGFNVPMIEPDPAYLAESVNVKDHNYTPVSGTVFWESGAIYFSPGEKWRMGEKYTCRIHGAFSAEDGRVVTVKTELVFFAVPDIEEMETVPSPEIAEVGLYKKEAGGTDYILYDYDADAYWNNVIDGEIRFKIYFDEEMDFSAPRKNLRMEPYRDYEVEVIDNKTLAVYVQPEAEPVKKITFTVKADMHSRTGIEMKHDYTFAFTEWKDDFRLDVMQVLQTDECYENSEIPLDALDKLFRVGAEEDDGKRFIDFTYQFSGSRMDLAVAAYSLSKITLIPEDRRIQKPPFLYEIMLYSPCYDQAWADVEYGPLDDPYRYALVIPGGIEGVHDGRGHYLKKDIKITLGIVDWDEIDPFKRSEHNESCLFVDRADAGGL
jgi:hypothetical protein